jgi:hypothetical protein
MSATPPTYQFPTPLRYLLWIVGGLAFCGQFTTFLLGSIKIDADPETHFLSAWITLLDMQQHAPAKILIPPLERVIFVLPLALVVAAAGSFSFFVFAAIRQRRFYGVASILCIPFSVLAAFISKVPGVDLNIDDLGPFGPNTFSLGSSGIEMFLGFLMPLMLYPIMFLIMLCFVVAQIVAAFLDRAESKSPLPSERDDNQPAGTRG